METNGRTKIEKPPKGQQNCAEPQPFCMYGILNVLIFIFYIIFSSLLNFKKFKLIMNTCCFTVGRGLDLIKWSKGLRVNERPWFFFFNLNKKKTYIWTLRLTYQHGPEGLSWWKWICKIPASEVMQLSNDSDGTFVFFSTYILFCSLFEEKKIYFQKWNWKIL